MSSNVSQSQLVAGIIGTIDIGSVISQSIDLALDTQRSVAKRDEINAAIRGMVLGANTNALNRAKTDAASTISEILTELPQDLAELNTLQLNQAVQSAGGYRIASAMLGQAAKYFISFNEIDFQTKVLIDIPETYAVYKAQKYYNKLFAPNRPPEPDMMIAAKNGKMLYTDIHEYYQQVLGLSSADADSLLTIREQQVGKPDPFAYWVMARKGIITDAVWYSRVQLGLGFSDDDAKALYQSYYYTLSPMELFRISDLTPVPSDWLTRKLSGLGFSDEDKQLVLQMILARTVKTEVTQAWAIILDNFSWGLQTHDDLTKFCTDNNIPTTEIEAKLNVANALKGKVILKLMRDAEIYLYRKGTVTEIQLYNNLLALDIDTAISNAIVRNEAAKQGVEWELP